VARLGIAFQNEVKPPDRTAIAVPSNLHTSIDALRLAGMLGNFGSGMKSNPCAENDPQMTSVFRHGALQG
jgi:hypothetical protein